MLEAPRGEPELPLLLVPVLAQVGDLELDELESRVYQKPDLDYG
jgi:hypothetical protein